MLSLKARLNTVRVKEELLKSESADILKLEFVIPNTIVVWKETQREVRQHWFIYSYISAYIQALYMYCPGLLEYVR